MDSVNLEVLRCAVGWIKAGVPGTLATVVKTWGSSPRPEGALLAISSQGRLVGSVSGGCIEDDLLERLRDRRPPRPEIVTYGVTAEQTRRFGLPCGGTLQLVLEPLHGGNRLSEVLERIERGELVGRRMRLADGSAELADAVPDSAIVFDGNTLVSAFGPRWRMLIRPGARLSGDDQRAARGIPLELDCSRNHPDRRDAGRRGAGNAPRSTHGGCRRNA
jgi:xanthine dehydrogenase accessory factor